MKRRDAAAVRSVLAVLTVFATAVTIDALEHTPAAQIAEPEEISLPQPTGPFPTGTASLHLIDHDRPETFTSDPNDVREFMVHLWYPSLEMQDGTKTRCIDYQNGRSLAEWLLPDWPDLHPYHAYAQGNSAVDAPLADAEDRFPVVLFSPGLGITDRAYTIFFEELASHGFVVAAISHSYFSGYTVFPDYSSVVTAPRPSGQGQAEWLAEHSDIVNQDAAFVLDTLEELDAHDPASRFEGRLDLANVGMFGHSYGGGNSLDMCLLDPRVDAAIDIDGGSIYHADTTGVDHPVMFLLTPERWQLFASIRSTWWRLRGPGYLVTIDGTTHLSFIDNGWIFTRMAGFEVMNDDDWRLGTIDPRDLVQIERAYVRTFFEAYLKGRGVHDLLRLESRFGDVRVQRKTAGTRTPGGRRMPSMNHENRGGAGPHRFE